MAVHHYSFPVVTGLDPGDPPPSRMARMAVYGRLMAELDANNQHYSEQISEIDLTDPEDARVLMPEQGADILAHFGEDHFLERYQRYKAHIAEWRQQYPRLATVDLRYDHQVVLEMASGMNATQPASDADGSDSPSADFSTVSSPGVAKPSAAGHSTSAPASVKTAAPKPSPRKPPGKALSGKSSGTKPGTRSAGSLTRLKTKPATRTKAAQANASQNKQRAQSKTAAPNLNYRKSSPTSRSQAPEGQ